jgi:hypothetical protein
MADIVTWMGRDAGCQYGCDGERGENLHFGNGSGSMRVSGWRVMKVVERNQK